MQPLLEVDDLQTHFFTPGGVIRAVNLRHGRKGVSKSVSAVGGFKDRARQKSWQELF